MKKPEFDESADIRMLKSEELASIKGGGVVDYLVKFASWGAGYFFQMGVREGRRMRALL